MHLQFLFWIAFLASIASSEALVASCICSSRSWCLSCRLAQSEFAWAVVACVVCRCCLNKRLINLQLARLKVWFVSLFPSILKFLTNDLELLCFWERRFYEVTKKNACNSLQGVESGYSFVSIFTSRGVVSTAKRYLFTGMVSESTCFPYCGNEPYLYQRNDLTDDLYYNLNEVVFFASTSICQEHELFLGMMQQTELFVSNEAFVIPNNRTSCRGPVHDFRAVFCKVCLSNVPGRIWFPTWIHYPELYRNIWPRTVPQRLSRFLPCIR